MASSISAFVFITNGPPLAIGSPIGLPAINKNSDFLLALIFNLVPRCNNIKFESVVLLWSFSPMSISPFNRYIKECHSEAPYLFAVAADGKQYQYYVCPAGLNNCGGGDERILEECNSYSRKEGGKGNCKIFARLRTIKWDNGSSRNKKIKSKWSDAEIREKLKEYNLYGLASSKPKNS